MPFLATLLASGSICAKVPIPEANQANPSPNVIAPEVERAATSGMVTDTAFTPGSKRETVPRSPFAIQTEPSPTASPVGVACSVMFPTTVRAAGSMRDIVRSSRFATQTAPSPVTTEPGRTPTGTEATTSFEPASMTATELAATLVPPADPWPRANTGMATAAARTPMSAAPAYMRRRRRESSTSSVLSCANSLRIPSISSWNSRSGLSRSFRRRSPRSRIATPVGSSSSTSSRVVVERSTWPPWPAAPMRAALCTPMPT